MAASTRTVTARAAQLLRTSTSVFPSPVARRNITTFVPRRPAPTTSPVSRNTRFASSSSSGGGSSTGLYALLALGAVGGGGYYLYSTGKLTEYFPFLHSGASADRVYTKGPDHKGTFEDYQQIYNEIAELLESNSDYDDGSYAPVCIRMRHYPSCALHGKQC